MEIDLLARARGWLAVRHSLRVEAAVVVGLYAAYETCRGLVAGDGHVAVRHARAVVGLERTLNVFGELRVQEAARSVPGLVGVLGLAYLTLHLGVTAGLLLWLHRRRPACFPLVRTTLLFASALALIGFLVFPTAPPRLAGLGIADTVSGRHIDLNKGLVTALYNPFAAMPSMHVGYAVIVGSTIARTVRGRLARALAIGYPLLVVFVIVATGNHFFLDAAAGASVALVAAAAAAVAVAQPRPAQLVTERSVGRRRRLAA